MPELPEVEVTRRGVSPHIAGQRVRRVIARAVALRWPVPPGLQTLLVARVVQRVERRGKYLLFEFDLGWLLIHLGMSGTLRVLHQEGAAAPGKHDHFDLVFDTCTLRLRDPRRFGAVLWHPREAGDVSAHPLLARLGIEPFDEMFSGAWLFRHTRERRQSIKQTLLGGEIVVGVGNIYASEALFRAGIRPTTAARRISLKRYERLAAQIRETLAEAIEKGGSTLRDFVGGDGKSGYFQLEHLVYDRSAAPCRVCGTAIRQIVQGQRSTFFCPRCQT